MKTIRKAAALLLALGAALLSGCRLMPEDPPRVMTTFYPLYALAVNVTRGVPGLTLNNLVQPQTGCPRGYVLSDWDAALIAGQDALIIGGRALESFESALNGAKGGPAVLTAMSGLTLYNGGAVNEESSHLAGDNPWLFLSVRGAMDIATSIAVGMAQLDEPYADIYLSNLDDYLARLRALEADMAAVVDEAPIRPVAVLHEGLGYFARELELPIACEYPREPGSDPYGADLDALLKRLGESGARVALVERQAPQNFTEALEAAGCVVARIDTLMTHAADGDREAYERVMLENARAVAGALNQAYHD